MKISQLRKEKKDKVEWKDIYEILRKEFGFWDKIASVSSSTFLKKQYQTPLLLFILCSEI